MLLFTTFAIGPARPVSAPQVHREPRARTAAKVVSAGHVGDMGFGRHRRAASGPGDPPEFALFVIGEFREGHGAILVVVGAALNVAGLG